MASPTQSLVIPAYNEAARLATAFERLRPTLEVMGPELTEIVMVDDGSTDDTMRVAHQVYGHLEHFRLVQHPHNMGKGAAVRTGMAHARYPKVIVADADMSIRPEHFVNILDTLERAPFAPGTRALNGKILYEAMHADGLGHRVSPFGAALHPGHRARHPVRLQGIPTRPRATLSAVGLRHRLRLRR